MFRHSLLCKALLIASISMMTSALFADSLHDDLGFEPIPESNIDVEYATESLYPREKLSAYGNPSFYHIKGKRYQVIADASNYDQVGIASWYGKDFHGKLTANREVYDMHAISAASKTLPIPCHVRVTNLENGKSLVVRVNDRGPYKTGRIIDLSYGAAQKLGFATQGITKVRVTTVSTPNEDAAKHYIQVASFSNEDFAYRFRDNLAQKTLNPIRINHTRNAQYQKLYRVEVGPFENTEELQSAQDRLEALGYASTIAILG